MDMEARHQQRVLDRGEARAENRNIIRGGVESRERPYGDEKIEIALGAIQFAGSGDPQIVAVEEEVLGRINAAGDFHVRGDIAEVNALLVEVRKVEREPAGKVEKAQHANCDLKTAHYAVFDADAQGPVQAASALIGRLAVEFELAGELDFSRDFRAFDPEPVQERLQGNP